MGFMKYNIDFEIIGSIIMLVIIIFFNSNSIVRPRVKNVS